MKSPIIIALDVESAAEARSLVSALGENAGFYKVGLELYAAAGVDFVRELLGQGKEVFLDLKFYDIGETVRRAVAQVAKIGVRFLTVHASDAVMRAAVDGRGDSSLQLLGVSVLTSVDQSDLETDGIRGVTVPELVEIRAGNARRAGVDGLVCSPREVRAVRGIAGPEMILVTPGVRSAGAATGDQKRVSTPEEAIANGADYLVIGREVVRSATPGAALAAILDRLTTKTTHID